MSDTKSSWLKEEADFWRHNPVEAINRTIFCAALFLVVPALMIAGVLAFSGVGALEPIFHAGQVVEEKTMRVRGVVLDSFCDAFGLECIYRVRFPGLQIKTNSRLLRPDDPPTIMPYTTINVKEHELRVTK